MAMGHQRIPANAFVTEYPESEFDHILGLIRVSYPVGERDRIQYSKVVAEGDYCVNKPNIVVPIFNEANALAIYAAAVNALREAGRDTAADAYESVAKDALDAGTFAAFMLVTRGYVTINA